MSEVNDPSNLSADAAPASRRQKQYSKRTDLKGRALTLAQEIKRLQEREEFAEFRGDLEQAIRRVRWQGGRTPSSDRDEVFVALEECDRMNVAATVADLVSDTGIEKAKVKAILDEFVMKDVVEMYERPDAKRGPKIMLYKLLPASRRNVTQAPAFARMLRSEDFDESGELRRAS